MTTADPQRMGMVLGLVTAAWRALHEAETITGTLEDASIAQALLSHSVTPALSGVADARRAVGAALQAAVTPPEDLEAMEDVWRNERD